MLFYIDIFTIGLAICTVPDIVITCYMYCPQCVVLTFSEVDKKIHGVAARSNAAPLRLEGDGLIKHNVSGKIILFNDIIIFLLYILLKL